ncbi:MAG: hypothetical protein UHO63_01035 [Blautia sp.]|nr:hypothetical protein [Blautia sp.]
MKLLLAEDDDKLRGELKKFFSMHGYETEEITEYGCMEERILTAGVSFCCWISIYLFWMGNICVRNFARRPPCPLL